MGMSPHTRHHDDSALNHAIHLVEQSDPDALGIKMFFHDASHTASYVVYDRSRREAAIVDSVRDFDPRSGRVSEEAATSILRFVEAERLTVNWLLETHVHADHLSAAPWLKKRTGGQIGVGARIDAVMAGLGPVLDVPADALLHFDHFFDDGEHFTLGNIPVIVLHLPGHTPADVAYIIGEAAFVGDTIFMPDYGTARADFPGGGARILYRSIRRLLKLPLSTRLFLCHDYGTPGRERIVLQTDVRTSRATNIHVGDGILEDSFVALREARDATLAMPQLFIPAIQINLAAGELPDLAPNGRRYMKFPLDAF